MSFSKRLRHCACCAILPLCVSFTEWLQLLYAMRLCSCVVGLVRRRAVILLVHRSVTADSGRGEDVVRPELASHGANHVQQAPEIKQATADRPTVRTYIHGYCPPSAAEELLADKLRLRVLVTTHSRILPFFDLPSLRTLESGDISMMRRIGTATSGGLRPTLLAQQCHFGKCNYITRTHQEMR